MDDKEKPKHGEKKGFFAKLIEKMDKKLEEKAQKSSCCGGSKDKKGTSCC